MTFRDRMMMLVACVVSSFVATAAVNVYFHGRATAEDPEVKDCIRAQRYECVDSDGNLRGVFATNAKTGMPVFALTDKDKNVRISVGVNEDGSSAIAFADPKGVTPVVIAAGDFGAALNLSDGKDTVRASFGIEKDGTAAVKFFDEKGKEIVK